jgi:ribosomal protein L37AE/L43A
MNSETRPALEDMAKQAGAIVRCPTCHTYDVLAGDSGAESMAYGMATNAWKRGEFGMDSREDIMSEMKSVLQDANIECPSCGRLDD